MALTAGLDCGSVSVKIAIIDEQENVLLTVYRRHKGHPVNTAIEVLREVSSDYPEFMIVFTGSTGKLMARATGAAHINELVANGTSTKRFYPEVNTIIEMGGEDSKLIILEGNAIKDFSLNSVCAAGTGSFLDQQAERLRLSIEEFSETALRSENPPRIAGRCSVFAKSDMIHLQQIATPMDDIVAGLCFAVARNFKGSIVRGRPVPPKVSFQGGVALNKGMIKAFKEIFELNELIIPEHTAFMGAIGAALKALSDEKATVLNFGKLEETLSSLRQNDSGHRPLIEEGDGFRERHLVTEAGGQEAEGRREKRLQEQQEQKKKVYLGIDIGSISTNLAVIDEDGRLIAKRYLMTAGRPIEAVRQGLLEVGKEVGDDVEICGVGTTGSGRYMIADFVGADIVKNEITAQATAAVFIDPEVDTIFEIGGQDSKYISLRNGIIVDFEMNKACAAGTGSFLEEQAEKLNISIKGEFADCAFSSTNPCRLGERCTVFMENSLMANLQRGAQKNDLLAGLAYSIVENYINRVVAGRHIGDHIFFQGGTAFNKTVVAAFEKFTGRTVTVPPNHDVTGAIGMAMIAREHMQAVREKSSGKAAFSGTSFKGFDLAGRPYRQSSFECRSCENMCEINRVKIDGEDDFLFYGGRCEKYDVRRRVKTEIPDLFAFREGELWRSHAERAEKVKESGATFRRGRIGIPYVFYFHDYLPYWSTLLWELGFEVVVSPKTNRRIVSLGLETVLAETCFPVKVSHGHVRHLLQEGVETLFIPSFINMNSMDDPYEEGHACPLTQSFPYQIRVAFENATVVSPVIKLKKGETFVLKEIKRTMRHFGITSGEIRKAMRKAQEAQDEFIRNIKTRGREVLSTLNKRTVVIVGRAYNAFDMGVNLEIPRKLASLDVLSLPMDFLSEEDIHNDWPDMYWRSGQKILKAARAIKKNKFLYPVFIGNFSCGPDSFIQKFFEKELSGKPYLYVEIDEHSADAGAITRCEAFLDSIDARISTGKIQYKETHIPQKVEFSVKRSSGKQRTVYLPRMSDHAFALKAAFEHCGIPAEVLPETDAGALEFGRRYVTGKECYPCTVTTGDMLKKVFSGDFKPEESAFFMPSGTGPCRFGQYNVFHRMVLDEVGVKDVPIFTPVQDVTFYQDLGIVGKDFVSRSWEGIVAFEILIKCLHESRPYEKEKGSADKLYHQYLQKLTTTLSGSNGNIMPVMSQMKKDFDNLPTEHGEKPLIGIVGEIFVRSNRFSNEDLVRKIETLGGEVWLSPVDEWIYYINLMSLKKTLRKKDISGIITILLKRLFQKRISGSLEKQFNGFLKTLHEPDTGDVLKKASPYLHESFEGEAIMSIGKSIDLIGKGVSGIINAMPFGCMPGTVVTAIMRGVTRKYGIPSISIPYDGADSSTTELQLEAFMEQVRTKTGN
ncbi:Activator of 2-hydroxyglutaryl-CoA dehydratase [hydrothermal vent metagenome]|uniref:Activator of 2-hydroxyglutaryl-CoA dehydratase n=1 Tax=hydrothermal vent metagenome TaxID=652676 RepID=A0A3B1CUF5_9ZZZZ